MGLNLVLIKIPLRRVLATAVLNDDHFVIVLHDSARQWR